MKKYKVREYINKLKEDNEIESLNMCDDILDIEINYMTYNSNNVDFDTMFICKGDNFKEEYLNSAIKNGAIVYVSEKKYNLNIPGIIVKNIRNSLSLLSDMYFDFPEKYLTKIDSPTYVQNKLADCNGDGAIDVRDATYIQKTIAKIPV